MTTVPVVQRSRRPDFASISAALCEPFPIEDIRWLPRDARVDHNGKPTAIAIPFIDARSVADRLDTVLGAENWKEEYSPAPNTPKGMMCRLYIRVWREDENVYEWIWREDASDPTDIEGTKGAMSGSFKRAGAKWGIGRYLYRLARQHAQFVERGKYYVRIKKNKDDRNAPGFAWNPPVLPSWAMPNGSGRPGPTLVRPIDRSDAGTPKTDRTQPKAPESEAPKPAATAKSEPAPAPPPVYYAHGVAAIDPVAIPLPNVHGFRKYHNKPLGNIPKVVLQEIFDSVCASKPNLAAHIKTLLERRPNDDLPF